MDKKGLIFGSLIFGFVLLASIDTTAQRKVISSNDFHRSILQPGVKYYEKSRHVETTDETFVNGAVVSSIYTVEQVLLPNRARFYEKEINGGVIIENERITIDFMQYTRKNNEPWVKVDMRGVAMGIGTGTGTGTLQNCEQYTVEDSFLNGQPMQMFEWISINANTKELRFREMRRWIGQSNLPYREETVTGNLSPREETTKRVITYEYDPAIKIEAPIK
ncbi:MAG TPA: hypothetical protein PLL77_11700 [Pyrinomonadaceae bacterium]|nr:hypothetical protein [Pyrinomonadaceae bacterium]